MQIIIFAIMKVLTAAEIRQAFLDFFKSKQHEIVASAPLVVKNDPTLMFINSGMAPFKDFFLGIGNHPIHVLQILKNVCVFLVNTMI
jgi:alanyl-tRNA synthetase